MRDVAASGGAEFLVVVHPDKLGFRRRSPWLNSLRRSPWLAGVPMVDMREQYRARRLRFPDVALDAVGHLNPRGHREAAEILRMEISRAGGQAQGHS
jgi:hypothetical protein